MKLATKLASGQAACFTFQGAPVRKPLLAVSGVVARGNAVLFSPQGSFIIPGSGGAVATMAAAAGKHPQTIPLQEENGVYVLRVQACAGDNVGGDEAGLGVAMLIWGRCGPFTC